SAWAVGPARVYGRLAELLVDFSPVPLGGRLVLDLGSGTGDGSRAALSAGALVIAADLALGMLLRGRDGRPPATVGDALALPFRRGAFDVVLAPFSLNHLDDPARGVREAGRVGGLLVASTYAADDDHPAKAAVETALSEVGWERPPWYVAVKSAMAAWGTVDRATAAIERGGMRPLLVERREIEFPDLGAVEMVEWRMGLAYCAWFVETLDPEAQRTVLERALALLGRDPEPIIRRVIFLAATCS
ncbi:MAG TPA: class I SAM-dependent methyltransferase, partial [Candidatus Limnocylindria bacterium]|nr:class I SAM-dependent methyltransferase [Candidatus Limnocylindria bacterium]